MKIGFLEIEPAEAAVFEAAFPEEELEQYEQLSDVPAEVEVLSIFIHSKIDAGFLAAHPALKFIATRSTTTEHIDLEACARRGIAVRNVPSYGDYTVTEHTFALILALARRLRQAMASQNFGSFSLESFRSMELHGKTLGSVGAGRIGRQTLRLGKAFGMETLVCEIQPDPEAAAAYGFQYVDFPTLLSRSHIISINVPLTPETFHLFDRDTFSKCRRGVLLINTARGRIIDSEALIDALDAGIVGGAGLDVLEDERVMHKSAGQIITSQIIEHLQSFGGSREPRAADPVRVREVARLMHNSALLSHPHVVFTPHVAFNSSEAIDRINRATIENIRAFAATPAKT